MTKLHLLGLAGIILVHSPLIAACTFPDAPNKVSPEWICNPSSVTNHLIAVGVGEDRNPTVKLEECKDNARQKMAKQLNSVQLTVLADLDGALSHSMLEKAVKMINIVMEQSTRTISKEAILLKKVTSPNNKLYCLISMDTDKYTVIKQATLEKKDILVPGIAEIMLHEWLLRLKKREKNVVIGCTFPDAPSARAPDWICNLESASEDNFSTVGTGNSASMHLKKAQCLGSARMQMVQTLHVTMKNMFQEYLDMTGTVTKTEQVTTQVTLQGTSLKKQRVSPNGVLYCLVSMEMSKSAFIKQAVAKSLGNQQAIWQKFQAHMSIDDMLKKLEAKKEAVVERNKRSEISAGVDSKGYPLDTDHDRVAD
ncbi:MAG: LPP20 family lipoprotein, partial [Thiotrichaceae bacterium]|nr:LPP20 family lipoprotein [Thiotrichaceae bacterium]